MNKFLSTVAALALVFAASTASAEDAAGKISEINQEDQTMTLDNGQTFGLAEGVSIEGLQPGAEVKVSYETNDAGKNIATRVEKASGE